MRACTMTPSMPAHRRTGSSSSPAERVVVVDRTSPAPGAAPICNAGGDDQRTDLCASNVGSASRGTQGGLDSVYIVAADKSSPSTVWFSGTVSFKSGGSDPGSDTFVMD